MIFREIGKFTDVLKSKSEEGESYLAEIEVCLLFFFTVICHSHGDILLDGNLLRPL